ncbi:serine/threonine protein kinase [bacterium]|nr:serine/threonine protein kinase [bacterium]
MPLPRNVTVGNKIAGYKIESKLGDDKSRVFLAVSPQGKNVALKILPPEVTAKSPNAGKRFLREARSLFSLVHENVVTVLDAGEDVGTLYLAMEYFEGKTLRALAAEQGGRMSEPDALRIATQVARGLAHLEKNKLVHRNIKPDHVLVGAGGLVKLVGLGLVKASEEKSEREADLTGMGTLVGTPHYMAPEQARGEQVYNAGTDMFSLGVTLYEVLAGEVPWKGERPMAVLGAISKTPPPPLVSKNPAVSPATVLVVEKLLAKTAEGRYPTTDVLVLDLVAIAEVKLEAGKPPSFTGKSTAPSGARAKAASREGADAGPAPGDSTRVALLAAGVVALAVIAVALIVLAFSR